MIEPFHGSMQEYYCTSEGSGSISMSFALSFWNLPIIIYKCRNRSRPTNLHSYAKGYSKFQSHARSLKSNKECNVLTNLAFIAWHRRICNNTVVSAWLYIAIISHHWIPDKRRLVRAMTKHSRPHNKWFCASYGYFSLQVELVSSHPPLVSDSSKTNRGVTRIFRDRRHPIGSYHNCGQQSQHFSSIWGHAPPEFFLIETLWEWFWWLS